MDMSEKAKAAGVNVNIISAGKFKAEASEFTPLSAEGRDHLQGLVNERYDAFVRAVARGRGVTLKSVRDGFGQGRLVPARDALSMGMVDSVETFDAVVSRTASRAVKARTIAEAASWQMGSTTTEDGALSAAVLARTSLEIAAIEDRNFAAQSVLAVRGRWESLADAKAWIREQGYHTERMSETDAVWRFPQRDPSDFEELHSVCANPSRDLAANALEARVLVIGGKLRAGAKPAPSDEDIDTVDEVLVAGVIPANVSEKIAPEGTTWASPALADFVLEGVASSNNWDENTDAQKRRVAMHAAWASAMPPPTFGDIKLFHHRPSDGAAVPDGVRNALARVNQTQGLGSDRPRVEAHLGAHMDAIQARRNAAMSDPTLDPDRVLLEIASLG
jgi:Peptidase family S49